MLHLKRYFLAILIGFTLLVCACGQTGDLYLPEDESKTEPDKSSQEKSLKEKSKT